MDARVSRNVVRMAYVLMLGCGPSGSSEGGSTDGASETQGDAHGNSADESGAPPDSPGNCSDLGDDDGVIGGSPLNAFGFPPACSPRIARIDNGYNCCSDDPATADGELPAYQGKGIAGSAPLYAGAANDAGTSGMCVRTADLPENGLLEPAASNCPIPCDPTWADADVTTVCGAGRVCCQTRELGEDDCVQDVATGMWRPVHGEDIGDHNVVPQTNWTPASHDTAQDPGGKVCMTFVGGDISSEVFVECIKHLGVANRRGYCMTLDAGEQCPSAAPSYIDACELKNGH